jgi:hypothetical protein
MSTVLMYEMLERTNYKHDYIQIFLDATPCAIDMHKCLYPEDGGIRFLVNVGTYLSERTASQMALCLDHCRRTRIKMVSSFEVLFSKGKVTGLC